MRLTLGVPSTHSAPCCCPIAAAKGKEEEENEEEECCRVGDRFASGETCLPEAFLDTSSTLGHFLGLVRWASGCPG